MPVAWLSCLFSGINTFSHQHRPRNGGFFEKIKNVFVLLKMALHVCVAVPYGKTHQYVIVCGALWNQSCYNCFPPYNYRSGPYTHVSNTCDVLHKIGPSTFFLFFFCPELPAPSKTMGKLLKLNCSLTYSYTISSPEIAYSDLTAHCELLTVCIASGQSLTPFLAGECPSSCNFFPGELYLALPF